MSLWHSLAVPFLAQLAPMLPLMPVALRRSARLRPVTSSGIVVRCKNSLQVDAVLDSSDTDQKTRKPRRIKKGSTCTPLQKADDALAEKGPPLESIEDKPKKRAKKVRVGGPSRELEEQLWARGFAHVCGVDEAGRGPLAGPVVAAAVVIPPSVTIPGIDDSKKLKEEVREDLYNAIVSAPGVMYAVEVVDERTIDEVNILQATMLAMESCVTSLRDRMNKSSAATTVCTISGSATSAATAAVAAAPSHSSPSSCGAMMYVLVDGNRLPSGIFPDAAEPVVKGDAHCHVIAAASILAKVTRDRIMLKYDRQWPEYGFKDHKGYGTVKHVAALLKHGPCDIHRRSFAPIKDWALLNKKTLGPTGS